MKISCLFILSILTLTAIAQNPLIVKSVGSTVLLPKDKDQEIWQNNEWNGKFFYQGTGTPLKLCVTDGTSAGTVHIKDITADFFQYTIPAQNFIYIITERSSGTYPNLLQNIEIWKSDGTAAGTILVKALPSFNPFSSTSFARWTSDKHLKRNFSVIGDVMYFVAYDATNGSELWKTDGTDAGTFMVKDIKPGTGTSYASSFCAIGNEVFFIAASTGFEQKLWKTDGTAAGTVQVAVPEPFFAVPYVGKVGNKMIFFANNTVHGVEPWVSDGTPAGTFMLADVNPGSANSTPSSEQNVHLRFNNNHCFFMANKTTGGKSLWRTDGTVAGTIQLTADGLITEENYSGGGYSDINNNLLYWIGANQKLYVSNGTVSGTSRVTTTLSNALYLKIYKDAAWFHARNSDNVNNAETYRSDGTAANTNRFEVQPGQIPSYPYGFFVTNNKLYFFTDSYAGKNLYQYNGDMTFNGGVAGGRWKDSANWNGMMPPGITDTAYINAGITVNIDGAKAFAGTLVVQNGATVNLTASADSLFVHAKIQAGAVAGNGVVVLRNFSGDTVKIAQAFTAPSINVDGKASLLADMTVSNLLNLTGNARLITNTSNVILSGTSSAITNTNSNYIVTNSTGALKIENIGSGGRMGTTVFPVGTSSFYNPLSLLNTGTADVFSARVQPGISNNYSGEVAAGGSYAGGAVAATWFLKEALAGGSNATVSLQWNGAQELPGFNRSQASVGHFTGGNWQLNTAGAAAGADPYTQTGSGYNSFSPFGVLNSNAVLPFTKLVLSVIKSSSTNRCSWQALNELGEEIILERSLNSKDFTSLKRSNYATSGLFDDATTVKGKIYYRLRLIEKNGAIRYSNIVWVNTAASNDVVVCPTLFSGSLQVQQNYPANVIFQLTGADGRLQLQQTLKQGTNMINTANLAKGTFFYQVIAEGQVLSAGKLTKQ